MNTLLFLTCGLALLSFLRCGEEEKKLPSVLRDCIWIFSGVCLFSGAAFALRVFLPLEVFEIELLVTAVFYILTLIFRRDISVFTAICGLGFWVFEHTFSWNRALTGFFCAGALYTFFRLAIGAFQNKSLFYKPPVLFAGYPVLMIQAFWASLVLAVMGLICF